MNGQKKIKEKHMEKFRILTKIEWKFSKKIRKKFCNISKKFRIGKF